MCLWRNESDSSNKNWWWNLLLWQKNNDCIQFSRKKKRKSQFLELWLFIIHLISLGILFGLKLSHQYNVLREKSDETQKYLMVSPRGKKLFFNYSLIWAERRTLFVSSHQHTTLMFWRFHFLFIFFLFILISLDKFFFTFI